MLAVHEAQQCLAWQTEIKIELLPHVSPADYAGMSAGERAVVGREGYQAYLTWKAENPDLVVQLEKDARELAGSRVFQSH